MRALVACFQQQQSNKHNSPHPLPPLPHPRTPRPLSRSRPRTHSPASHDGAPRAGRLLDEIVPSIQRTSALVQEISAASAEQSESVAQIGGAMSQLSRATQQNASASEQLAATSEELSGQAEQLQQTVAFFQLGDGQPAAPAAPALRTRQETPALVERRTAVPQLSGGAFGRGAPGGTGRGNFRPY